MFHVVVYVEVSCKDRVSEQQLSTEHYNAESGDTNRWSIKRYMLRSCLIRTEWKLKIELTSVCSRMYCAEVCETKK